MAVDGVVGHQPLVEYERYSAIAVVDERKRSHGPWGHAEHLHEKLRLAKAPPGTAQNFRQRLEVDLAVALRRHQEQLAFGVLEKQILGVAAGKVAFQLFAFGHREHGLVLDRSGLNAKLGQTSKQVGACGRHAGWSPGEN